MKGFSAMLTEAQIQSFQSNDIIDYIGMFAQPLMQWSSHNDIMLLLQKLTRKCQSNDCNLT